MKRDHTNTDDYIQWLKSIGCVVYLPLSEEGDLRDRISGLSLQLTGNGSMVWDNSKSMYLITQPSQTTKCVATLDNGADPNTFSENKVTSLHTVQSLDNTSSKIVKGISINTYDNQNSISIGPHYNGGSGSHRFQSLVNVGICIDNSTTTYFQDGMVYASVATPTNRKPGNWNWQGTGFLFGNSTSGSECETRTYFKNIYIFNKLLELSTIRKIQGYE